MASKAPDTVMQSATGIVRLENAATSADSPEANASNILSAIVSLNSQIKGVRHKYDLDATIGPANKDLEVSSFFTQDALKRWLAKTDPDRAFQPSTESAKASKADCERKNSQRLERAQAKNPLCRCSPIPNEYGPPILPMPLALSGSAAKCAKDYCDVSLDVCPSK
jgi:hypothetical protein